MNRFVRHGMRSAPVLVILVGLAAAVMMASPAGQREAAAADEHPVLSALMAMLLDDLDALNASLLRSEFARAALAADRIAEHPMVDPADRTAIAAALGTEMAAFKRFDTSVHDAAAALAVAARAGDEAAMASRYGQLVSACMGCHATFRARVRAALGAR